MASHVPLSTASYVPLWCKSNFSFLEGASHPDELMEQAHRLGLSTLALTDRNGVYGVVRAHLKARELGLKLIIGAQVTVEDDTTIDTTIDSTIVLLARNKKGYANLCRLITGGRINAPKGTCTVFCRAINLGSSGLKSPPSSRLTSPASCRP